MKARILTIGLVAAGLGLVPTVAHATSSGSSGTTTATTTPKAPATTTVAATPKSAATTTASTAPKTTTTTGRYEVVSGTYSTKAKADKHLAALDAAGLKGFSVHEIGKKIKRYRVEERHLTKAEAKAAVKSLHASKFVGFYIHV